MKHILIISSYAPSLINFRFSFIKELLLRGNKVSVAVPKNGLTNVLLNQFRNLKINVNIFNLSRTGLNFFENYKSYLELRFIIEDCKPDIILSYTAKPVIFTGLLLKYFSKINFYALITGLGYGFTSGKTLKRKFIKFIMTKFYRKALKSATKVIFQNKDDRNLFYQLKIFPKKNLTHIINGSGVDLKAYPFSPLPSKPIFLMIARLAIDKGVREYVKAARGVRLNFPNVLFHLVGQIDENPSSISTNELKSWIDEGVIQYLGQINSVQSVLKSCKFFVLPSYREGTPRSTLEALATGRPVITTNVPGCRETVIHKRNGLLVPARNSKALEKAMIRLLLEKKEKIQNMANESFLIAKNKYDVKIVNKDILKIMDLY
jgi:glycosyltransferase involved in cell wall biosynthesis